MPVVEARRGAVCAVDACGSDPSDSGLVRVVDPEETHLAALRQAIGFRGRRVLEIGCGEGRLTWGIAADADYVLATDPNEERVAQARAACPEQLREKVRFEVAEAASLDVPRSSFDIVLFSWSL